MEKLIEVQKLKKEFPVKGMSHRLVAVDEVTFSILKGRTFGLIGESGSGKTTVGRVLLKLISHTAGRMFFDGREYQGMSKRGFRNLRNEMQMVFQDPYYSLNPRRTIWETIRGSYNQKNGDDRHEKSLAVREALDKVYIEEKDYDKYPHQLSMGQQQRVGIARAIVSSPRFIVLDEPTSSLDVTVRGEIIDLLVRLQQDLDITYLFISHDLSTVQYLCHDVAIMYLGKIIEIGPVKEVFENHRHPYSVALMASVMKPNPKVKRLNYRLEGEIPSPINLPPACYLASRCPEAKEVCHRSDPEMIEVGGNHYVKCHFAKSERKLAT
ncbi:MAG: ABC transporter ATP-binding protein [Spirochaetia bacterium]|jgi:oligopeptide/dipeptide ABC transporter ATP-binding protein